MAEELGAAADQVSNEAFEKLAREHFPRLYSVARRLTDEGAEDLVQECLLRAYRARGAGAGATPRPPARTPSP